MDARWLNAIEWFYCELLQCEDEGKDVSKYKDIVLTNENVFQIYEELYNLPLRKDYKFIEPNEFEEIIKEAPKGKVYDFDKEKVKSKIKAGWYGRVIGNELGKPIEGLTRASIKELEIESKNYPLTDYFDSNKFSDEFMVDFAKRNHYRVQRQWLKNGFEFAKWDDDLNYTVANMLLIEKYGRNFKPEDVISLWTDNFPISALCTAEKIAYKNAILNMVPPVTARYANPFREWVGAAIRGDMFGYVNPANPFEAARMAYNDACISHVKNGIYGEIFVSVLTSLAFSITNPKELVEETLKYIPSTSRLYSDIKLILKCYEDKKSVEEAEDLIHEIYDEKNPQYAVHTNANCMVMALAILYANNDFDKVLRYSIDTGYDTDSNTAIVASVVGIVIGFDNIDPKWYQLFNGLLETKLINVGTIKIDDLVERTYKL